MAEIQSGSITAKYLRGINLISRTAGNTTEYYLFNAHGDVVNLVNADGAVIKIYDYDAFGNEQSYDPADPNPFRYCGEYWDNETGTYYLRARYYAPDIGRFTQMDKVRYVMRELPGETSIIDPLSLNLYAYCAGNPIAYYDPSGNAWETVFDIISLGSSALTFAVNPTPENALYLLWDIGGVLVPLVPGSYVAKGARLVGASDNIDDVWAVLRKLDNAADILAAVAKRPDSKVLRNALEAVYKKAGKEIPTSHAAHHIVAGGATGAAEARMILAKFGIDINDAANGVFLPTVKGISEAAYHNTLHTKEYYQEVNKLLREAESAEEVIDTLIDIAKQLQTGTFMK